MAQIASEILAVWLATLAGTWRAVSTLFSCLGIRVELVLVGILSCGRRNTYLACSRGLGRELHQRERHEGSIRDVDHVGDSREGEFVGVGTEAWRPEKRRHDECRCQVRMMSVWVTVG